MLRKHNVSHNAQPLVFNGNILNLVETHKQLGVTFSRNLYWS